MNAPHDPREAHSALDLMDDAYQRLGEALAQMRVLLADDEEADDDDRD
jgi:hypothetical protein